MQNPKHHLLRMTQSRQGGKWSVESGINFYSTLNSPNSNLTKIQGDVSLENLFFMLPCPGELRAREDIEDIRTDFIYIFGIGGGCCGWKIFP